MDERELLAQVTRELLGQHCTPETVRLAERDGWAPDLWAALSQAELPLVGIPEGCGGAGGGLGEASEVVRLAGHFAAPVPLAETALLAGWVLARANAPVPAGPLSAAPCEGEPAFALRRVPQGWCLSGRARGVPWARVASRLVLLARADGQVLAALVDPADCRITPGVNLAGEPRDAVEARDVPLAAAQVVEVPADVSEPSLRTRGALARALQLVGTLERVLDLTMTYAQQREQFGRPLAKFQAVQQSLALMASEVATSRAAAEGATAAAEHGEPAEAVALAKIRAGEAAGLVARLAHQLHGAIGYTHEHALQLFTRRLWSWRDEFGADAEWAAWIGERLVAGGPDELWRLLTDAPAGVAPTGVPTLAEPRAHG